MNREQQSLHDAKILAEKKEYDEAFLVLGATDGAKFFWLKGTIMMLKAEEESNGFRFRFYPTEEMILQYRSHLQEAYDIMFQAVLSLLQENQETIEFLNKHLWRQIGKIENEIIRTKYMYFYPSHDENSDCMYDDTNENENEKVDDEAVEQVHAYFEYLNLS